MNTIQDQNVLHLTFQFKYEHDKLIKQSLNHLTNLIGHEGPGSLFQCLKQLNLISGLETATSTSFITVFRQANLTLVLTEDGLRNFKQVMAITSHYLELIKSQWLSASAVLPSLFEETQTVNKLGFGLYKVPDQLDFVCDLATTLLFTKDPS